MITIMAVMTATVLRSTKIIMRTTAITTTTAIPDMGTMGMRIRNCVRRCSAGRWSRRWDW